MATQRIRYFKTGTKNVIESKQRFESAANAVEMATSISTDKGATTATSYKVRINLDSNTYTIFEADHDVVAATGVEKDLHRVKIAVKQALTQLGVIFAEKEVRTSKLRRALTSLSDETVLDN